MTSQRPWIEGLPTRLRLGDALDAGATSSVWRARDVAAGVDVVVKVLAVDGAERRLEREARALARLRGVPGIVAVRELGRSPDGTAWVVCDLAPGGSLRDRIDAAAPGTDALDPARARAATRQIAAALSVAHGRQVVHGDLSPANVLFDHDGAALLADFGAADLDGSADPVHQGLTPAFAAPERRRGAAASPAGDVYSLGSTVLAACSTPDEPLAALLAACCGGLPSTRPSAPEIVESLDRSEPATSRSRLRWPVRRGRTRR